MSAGADQAVAPSSASLDAARVTIVGAGSLGLVLAAALASAGHRVTLLARAASAAALLDLGVIRVSGQLARAVPVRALPPEPGEPNPGEPNPGERNPGEPNPGQVAVCDDPRDLPDADAVLFTSKGHDLPQSIEEVADAWPVERRAGSFVAGLQNGVVKDELLAAAFGSGAVVGAATVLGAQRMSVGEATVAGLGTTYFGEFDAPSSARTELMAAALAGAGLPSVVVAEIRSLLWAKFCNAIGIFGVSALTRLPSVEIFARPSLALAYRSLLDEAAAVAAAEGVTVRDFPDLPMRTYLEPTPEEAVAEMSRRVSRVPGRPPGFSSIVQDLAAGRRTEIEETFGDLVRRAHARGLPVPCSELVYRIVGGIWPDANEPAPPGPGIAAAPI
jgi:2-dehydropantoate 2-reductase